MVSKHLENKKQNKQYKTKLKMWIQMPPLLHLYLNLIIMVYMYFQIIFRCNKPNSQRDGQTNRVNLNALPLNHSQISLNK